MARGFRGRLFPCTRAHRRDHRQNREGDAGTPAGTPTGSWGSPLRPRPAGRPCDGRYADSARRSVGLTDDPRPTTGLQPYDSRDPLGPRTTRPPPLRRADPAFIDIRARSPTEKLSSRGKRGRTARASSCMPGAAAGFPHGGLPSRLAPRGSCVDRWRVNMRATRRGLWIPENAGRSVVGAFHESAPTPTGRESQPKRIACFEIRRHAHGQVRPARCPLR